MVGSGVAARALDEGWTALGQGCWHDAARAFDRALAADPADPLAAEGRAWAAWWLDDARTLFTAREQAYRAHRDRGDVLGAARAATWLGCDHHEIRGEHAVARGWYARAHRLLEGLPPGRELGWLLFQEGAYALELADDTETALQRASEVVAIAREVGAAELELVAQALEGLALVTRGAVDQGMRRLDEVGVAATSGDVPERIAVNWTLCYVVYACERARDFDRLAQWCRRMQEASERFGFTAGIGICRVHYGGVLVLRGSWDEAEHELQRARRIFAAVRPMAVAEPDARLGELRRRQGRLDEAAELLERALPHPLAALGLASMALERGEADRALEHLVDVIAATPAGSVTQLVDVHALLAVAHARLGRFDEAGASLSWLQATSGLAANPAVAGIAEAASGAVAAAMGDLVEARRHLVGAGVQFERAGLPWEAARTRLDLADVLERLGREDDAATERADAHRRLRDLGSEGAGASGRVAEPGGQVQVPGLTRREVEVLDLLSRGLTDREIADRLTISPHTVHRHVGNLLRKLAVPSRAAAAAHGARHGVGA